MGNSKKGQSAKAKTSAKENVNNIKAVNESSKANAKDVTKADIKKLGLQAVKVIDQIRKSEAGFLLAQIKRYIKVGEIVAKTMLKGDSLEVWAQEYLNCGQSNARKYKNIFGKKNELIDIATNYELSNAKLNSLATLAGHIGNNPAKVDKALTTTTDVEEVNSIVLAGGKPKNGKKAKSKDSDPNSNRLASQNLPENWAANFAKMKYAFEQMDDEAQKLCIDATRLFAAEIGVLKSVKRTQTGVAVKA